MKIARWAAKNGYRDSLVIGIPLVISMLSSMVMTFTDRIFLGNYSLDALAASLPASLAAFLFLSFFFGIIEYTGVFISQYDGGQHYDRVGSALWQGIWFSLAAGLMLASLWFVAGPLFELAGHPEGVRALEVAYFRVLTLGGGPFLLGICFSSFFSGRGKTKPVMIVNIAATVLNIPLDYCLINGVGPFPELGIVGAGFSTVVGYTIPALCLGYMTFTPAHESRYKVYSAFRFEGDLFRRFMKFGLPGGVQFFIDMFAVSFFVFMVGRIGELELAATNIAVSIYTLAFLPIDGLHISVSIMVGQSMGNKRPQQAEFATKSVLHLALFYMASMGALFLLFPEPFIELFRPGSDPEANFGPVVDLSTQLLRYVAALTVFDAIGIILMGSLKGAGDTLFVMICVIAASMVCMVVPLCIFNVFGMMNIHIPWLCLLAYSSFLAIVFTYRFRHGSWRTINVVEW